MARFDRATLPPTVLLCTVMAGCGSESASDTTAASGPEPAVIDERQANFEKIGDSFKAIRGQLEGGNPDFAAIENAATQMNAAAIATKEQFPEGTSVDDGWDTEALTTIWEKPDEFTEANQALLDASAQMITLAQNGDAEAVGGQVGAVGSSCKGCHDNFRLETD
ncbi:MAG: cytochrome c [Pseudomonadota bacterium]